MPWSLKTSQSLVSSVAAIALRFSRTSSAIVSCAMVVTGSDGQRTEALVWQGAWRLHEEGETLVGMLVFLTAFVFPLVQIAGLLAILVPLRFGLSPRYLVPAYRTIEEIKAWSMVEVFMLGVLVSLVKLAHMAQVVPGAGMWGLFGLIITLAWASSTLNPHEVWARLDVTEPEPAT